MHLCINIPVVIRFQICIFDILNTAVINTGGIKVLL